MPGSSLAPSPVFFCLSRVHWGTMDLAVNLGPLRLNNPIMVASGTFGYAREMEKLVDLSRLGAIIPKTITPEPRRGNAPWRTVETASGLLNSIGLDNDGCTAFVQHHMPYLSACGAPVVVSIAAGTVKDFAEMARRLTGVEGVAAIELNISCPNVAGGVDFGTDPALCHELLAAVRDSTTLPLFAKLTPNVTDIARMAQAAEQAGADAITAINTLLGMSIDWRRRRPMLGQGMGGLSGPAIKPVALRCVYQVAQAVSIPVIGVGGVATLDDVMEFLVAGASAVQLGTVNFYDPTASIKIIDGLDAAVAALDASSWADVVGSLSMGHLARP